MPNQPTFYPLVLPCLVGMGQHIHRESSIQLLQSSTTLAVFHNHTVLYNFCSNLHSCSPLQSHSPLQLLQSSTTLAVLYNHTVLYNFCSHLQLLQSSTITTPEVLSTRDKPELGSRIIFYHIEIAGSKCHKEIQPVYFFFKKIWIEVLTEATKPTRTLYLWPSDYPEMILLQ